MFEDVLDKSLEDKFKELKQDYQELKQETKNLQIENEAVRERFHRRHEYIRELKEFVDRMREKISDADMADVEQQVEEWKINRFEQAKKHLQDVMGVEEE